MDGLVAWTGRMASRGPRALFGFSIACVGAPSEKQPCTVLRRVHYDVSRVLVGGGSHYWSGHPSANPGQTVLVSPGQTFRPEPAARVLCCIVIVTSYHNTPGCNLQLELHGSIVRSRVRTPADLSTLWPDLAVRVGCHLLCEYIYRSISWAWSRVHTTYRYSRPI